MKVLLFLLFIPFIGKTQEKLVSERVSVNEQSLLVLDFAFADNIVFETWDKEEVLVEVTVNINDGVYNDIFSLKSSNTESAIYISMDKEMWKKIDRKQENCSWQTEIHYKVFLPDQFEIKASTISGDYELVYFGSPIRLKTISGIIDLTVPRKSGLDFRAKTISGEVFSDLEIDFPNGKDGLRQIVGQNIEGRIGQGGEESSFETISGNIYLRKE